MAEPGVKLGQEVPPEAPAETSPVAPTAPAQPVVKIELPLADRRFDKFLDVFMQRTNISDRSKAAMLAAYALRDIGLDPAANLEETVKATQFLASVLQVLPDAGEITRQTKDMITAEGAAKLGQKYMEGPTSEERMERMMQTMMPWTMLFRMMSGDAGGSTKSTDVEALIEAQDKKWEERFEKLRAEAKDTERERKSEERFTRLEAMIGAKKPEEADAVLKKFDELKEAIKEGKGKSEVTDKIDALTKAITEKKESDKFDTMRDQMDAMKSGLEDKIANLQGSMNQGAPKTDVMSQATELMNVYNKFMEMAKTFGLEGKDDKVTGDLKRDMIKLGKDIIGVVGKAVDHRGEAPPRQQVQQLPVSAIIPIGEASGPAHGITETRISGTPPAGQTPAQPAQPAQPTTLILEQEVSPITNEARYQQEVLTVAPFAKKPKPVEVPATPAETPAPAAPAEVPQEGG